MKETSSINKVITCRTQFASHKACLDLKYDTEDDKIKKKLMNVIYARDKRKNK